MRFNVIKEAFAKVYADGYHDGYKDRENEIPVDLRKEHTMFVDLGLPSGTLWSADYEKSEDDILFVPYIRAQEFDIPTEEQWDEVCRYCRFENDKIIGPSGERIGYGWAPAGYQIYNLGEGCEEGKNMFWLKGEVDTENTAPTMLYDIKREDKTEFVFSHVKGTSRHFTGFKLPIFLVKNKE